MNRKKFTRAAKIATASLVAFTMTTSPVFAATGDLWKGTTNKGSVAQMILGGSAGRLDFAANMGQYTYEVDGVGYAVGEVDTMFKANPTLSTAEVQAKVKAELTGTPVSDELVVESVSAITTTYVEVTFAALKEAIAGFTVEVKDSKGTVVAVVAQDLAVGATSAQFDFVAPVAAADLAGVWTVDGVEYSFAELALVANIVTASAAPVNEITLLGLLEEAGIQNVDMNSISAYAARIVVDAPVFIADVQKSIDDVNADAAEAGAEAAIVKAVVDAANQIQLKAALEANFDRVNPVWMADYATENVGGTGMLALTDVAGVTVDLIQAAIDTANNAAIAIADGAAATAADQVKVTALIQAWTEDDVAPATTKATAIKNSQIKEAGFKVAEATTENSLYNALVALANLDSTDLPATALNANLKAEYFAELDAAAKLAIVAAPDGSTVNTEVVSAADAAALTAALSTIDGLTTANTAAEVKAALQELADVTAHKSGTAKFAMSTVVDANLLDYVTLATDGFEDADILSIALVNIAITAVNDSATLTSSLDVINDTASTSAQVRDALLEISVATTLSTGTTNADYIDLSAQAQLEVAQLVIDARPAAPGYAALDAILLPADGTGALDNAMTAHTAKVAEFNAIGDLAVATTSTIKANLDTYAYDEYVALTSTQKIAVAAQIDKLTKDVSGVATPLNFSGADAVKTLAEANAIIDAAIAAIQ